MTNKKAETEGGLGAFIIKALLWAALLAILFLGVYSFLKKSSVL